MKFKKNDQVMVIAGKDVGKQGVIDKVFPKMNRVIVSGVNLAKHHLKPSRKNPHGGIMDKLAPIDASNIILVCPRCQKLTRISYKVVKTLNVENLAQTKTAKKIRLCRKCQESID